MRGRDAHLTSRGRAPRRDAGGLRIHVAETGDGPAARPPARLAAALRGMWREVVPTLSRALPLHRAGPARARAGPTPPRRLRQADARRTTSLDDCSTRSASTRRGFIGHDWGAVATQIIARERARADRQGACSLSVPSPWDRALDPRQLARPRAHAVPVVAARRAARARGRPSRSCRLSGLSDDAGRGLRRAAARARARARATVRIYRTFLTEGARRARCAGPRERPDVPIRFVGGDRDPVVPLGAGGRARPRRRALPARGQARRGDRARHVVPLAFPACSSSSSSCAASCARSTRARCSGSRGTSSTRSCSWRRTGSCSTSCSRRSSYEDYPLFLLCGLVVWLFFAQSLTQAATSLLDQGALVRKARFAREAIPASVVSGPARHVPRRARAARGRLTSRSAGRSTPRCSCCRSCSRAWRRSSLGLGARRRGAARVLPRRRADPRRRAAAVVLPVADLLRRRAGDERRHRAVRARVAQPGRAVHRRGARRALRRRRPGRRRCCSTSSARRGRRAASAGGRCSGGWSASWRWSCEAGRDRRRGRVARRSRCAPTRAAR